MKSRKYIAETAVALIDSFDKLAPQNKEIQQLTTYAQKKLAARQTAPQNIFEKIIPLIYKVIQQQNLNLSPEAFKVLKQMEILAREKTILPFKRYDPWD
ncbi:hypothetical protein LB941_07375 [Ligilactobacillus sp. WILCCON 0076]|uniref:Uncharacterized protein n=1 Tax=Ligilactobacillus ubinensis TaxID=2876789 RepID=A0A9X2FL13_9LACO|nr:hypothetical protein [Ligilactobacillus ubinensis]MCP0887154.1 hypothetical protein [Ligilactobacillus ubinensis]